MPSIATCSTCSPNWRQPASGATRLASARSPAKCRAAAEPHFRYEQRALFPQLVSVLGPDRVERLYADQDGAVEALLRIEALAEPGPMGESNAAEARRLTRAARASVANCDSVCEEIVDQQPPEVAERVLAARQRVLAGTPGRGG